MVRDYVIQWFIDRTEIINNLDGYLETNYVKEGIIDSFSFIEMISVFEDKFHISFTDEDFNDERLFTIAGLIEIIEGHIK